MAKTDIANPTGIPEIDSIMTKLSKDFGHDVSGENYGNLEFFPSGSTTLDIALGRGGFPMGRMVEFIGTNQSFKTSLALTIMAAHQRWRKANGIDKRDIILDLEHSLEADFIKGFGIDLSLVIWKRFDSAEESLQFAIDLIKSGKIGVVLYDSIDAAENEKQIRRQIGETDVGGISKEMNKACRELSKLVAKTNTLMIWINQIKMNPGQMFGSPETTSGGSGTSYYCRLRFKMLPRKESSDYPNTGLMRIRVVKTGLTAPVENDIELIFTYGSGFNEVADIETTAKNLEILKHTAGQTKVQWTSESEMVPLMPDIDKGKEAGIQALKDNPLLLERLRHACLRAAGIKNARPDTDFNI